MLLSESRENQLKYRKTRLAIVLIVCALAIIQIVYACTGPLVKNRTISDYIEFIKETGHDWWQNQNVNWYSVRYTFYAGFSLHIIIPILITITVILLYIKKKRQVFVLPILQIMPALLIQTFYTDGKNPYLAVMDVWVSTSKYALSVGIISTVLLLVYDLLPYIGKITEKKRLDRSV